MPPKQAQAKKTRVVEVHARLFPEDVAAVKRMAAAKRIPWQIELRLVLHRALNVNMVKDPTDD